MVLRESGIGEGDPGHDADHYALHKLHNRSGDARKALTIAQGPRSLRVKPLVENAWIQQDESSVLFVRPDTTLADVESYGLMRHRSRAENYFNEATVVNEPEGNELWLMQNEGAYNRFNYYGTIPGEGLIWPDEWSIEIDFQVVGSAWSGLNLHTEFHVLLQTPWIQVLLHPSPNQISLGVFDANGVRQYATLAPSDTQLPADTTRTIWACQRDNYIHIGIVGELESRTELTAGSVTVDDDYYTSGRLDGIRILEQLTGGTANSRLAVKMRVPRIYRYARFPSDYTTTLANPARSEPGPAITADVTSSPVGDAVKYGVQTDAQNVEASIRDVVFTSLSDKVDFQSAIVSVDEFSATLDGSNNVTDVDVSAFEAMYANIKSVPMNLTFFRNHPETGGHTLADGEPWGYTPPAGAKIAADQAPYFSPPDDYALYGDILAAIVSKLLANGWTIYSTALWYETNDPNDGWWLGTQQEFIDLWATVMPKIKAAGAPVGTTHLENNPGPWTNAMIDRATADAWEVDYLTMAFIKTDGLARAALYMRFAYTYAVTNHPSIKCVIVQNWHQYLNALDWFGYDYRWEYVTQEKTVYHDLRAPAYAYALASLAGNRGHLAAMACFSASTTDGPLTPTNGGIFEGHLPTATTPLYGAIDVLTQHQGQRLPTSSNFPWLHGIVTVEDDGRILASYGTLRYFNHKERKRFSIELENLPAEFYFRHWAVNESNGRLELVASGDHSTYSSVIEAELAALGLVEITPAT